MIKMSNIENLLKANYLIGVDVYKSVVEVTLISMTNYKVSREQIKYKKEDLDLLHELRRKDLTLIFDSIINELYIEETNDISSASIDFIINDRQKILKYYVSKDLVRKSEEIDFIENYVKLFCKGKQVFNVSNNVLDILGLYDNKKISFDSDVTLLDKGNSINKLHIKGKTICPFIMNYIESKQELSKMVKER